MIDTDYNILDEFTTYYTKVGQTNSVGSGR